MTVTVRQRAKHKIDQGPKESHRMLVKTSNSQREKVLGCGNLASERAYYAPAAPPALWARTNPILFVVHLSHRACPWSPLHAAVVRSLIIFVSFLCLLPVLCLCLLVCLLVFLLACSPPPLGRVRSFLRARPLRCRSHRIVDLPPVPLGEELQGAAAARQRRRRGEERGGLLRQDDAAAAEGVHHAGHGQHAAGLQGKRVCAAGCWLLSVHSPPSCLFCSRAFVLVQPLGGGRGPSFS